MRGLFIQTLGACNIAPFQFKRDPAIIGAIITAAGALASTATSSIAQSNLNADNRDFSREMTEQQNQFNREEAEKARMHQASLLSAEQNWNEFMYNQYQSPSALRRQYEEAGYNPYLVEGSGHVGGSVPTGPTAPSTAQAQGSNPFNPQTQVPNYGAFASGLSDAAHMYFNAKQATANTANVNAMALKNIAEAANYLIESGYSEDEVQKVIEPYFKSSQGMNSDSNLFVQGMVLANQEKKINIDRQKLAFALDKQFGEKERVSMLAQIDQTITESAAKIGLMASEAKLNDSKCEQIAQDIVESLSRIYKNTAEGSLADVQGLEIMTLLGYTETLLSYQVQKSALENEETSGNEGIKKFNKTLIGKSLNIITHYLQRVFSAGNVGINVGLKGRK